MATNVKHGDTISANATDYVVSGIVEGRMYQIGLLYRSGTGTMSAVGFADAEDGAVNTIYSPFDGTTAITVTATTPRAFEVRAIGPFLRFTIASASSLNAKLICKQIAHGF